MALSQVGRAVATAPVLPRYGRCRWAPGPTRGRSSPGRLRSQGWGLQGWGLQGWGLQGCWLLGGRSQPLAGEQQVGVGADDGPVQQEPARPASCDPGRGGSGAELAPGEPPESVTASHDHLGRAGTRSEGRGRRPWHPPRGVGPWHPPRGVGTWYPPRGVGTWYPPRGVGPWDPPGGLGPAGLRRLRTRPCGPPRGGPSPLLSRTPLVGRGGSQGRQRLSGLGMFRGCGGPRPIDAFGSRVRGDGGREGPQPPVGLCVCGGGG